MTSAENHPDPLVLLQLIEETAVAAGRQACEQWGKPLAIASKGYRDIVTEADVATQKLITTSIRDAFPDHGFLTEEDDGELPVSGPVIWIIDPIDGTTNYSRQLPTYCVSIAAVMGTGRKALGEPVLAGAVFDPMRDELFSAALGHGATVRLASGERRPLLASSVSSMPEAVVGLDWSRHPSLRARALSSLENFAHEVHTMRAIGAAALALAWVAAGRLDCYLNYSLKDWDVAAAALLIKEAGGQLSQTNGQPWAWFSDACDCVASNGLIHQEFLRLIA